MRKHLLVLHKRNALFVIVTIIYLTTIVDMTSAVPLTWQGNEGQEFV